MRQREIIESIRLKIGEVFAFGFSTEDVDELDLLFQQLYSELNKPLYKRVIEWMKKSLIRY